MQIKVFKVFQSPESGAVAPVMYLTYITIHLREIEHSQANLLLGLFIISIPRNNAK